MNTAVITVLSRVASPGIPVGAQASLADNGTVGQHVHTGRTTTTDSSPWSERYLYAPSYRVRRADEARTDDLPAVLSAKPADRSRGVFVIEYATAGDAGVSASLCVVEVRCVDLGNLARRLLNLHLVTSHIWEGRYDRVAAGRTDCERECSTTTGDEPDGGPCGKDQQH